MSVDRLLSRLASSISPAPHERQRIERLLMSRLGEPLSLRESGQMVPSAVVKAAIWRRVTSRIGELRAATLLDQLRGFLSPPPALRQQLGGVLQGRMTPQPIYVYDRFKWVAAGLVATLVVASSPAFFLTSTTVADSQVLLVPTAGTVEIDHGDESWQPVADDMVLEPGVRVRTRDGQASIIYRDDAVVRLDADTLVEVRDTGELLEPAPDLLPAFALLTGRVWLQGLLPSNLRGLTVAIPEGNITVHEGSASVFIDEAETVVTSWDRHAEVSYESGYLTLVAGEKAALRSGETIVADEVPVSEYTESWPTRNLERDAVHRRHLAQLQQERWAARAGILPTSALYPVKRVAETVDVLLTFNENEKTQKKLDLAENRLNEAAALLLTETGSSVDIAESLAGFKGTLLDLAASSGSNTVSQFLLRQSLMERLADVAVLQPGDNGYRLKEAVIETTTQLSQETLLDSHELQTMLFVDALATLNDAVARADASTLQETWEELQTYVRLVEEEDSPLPPALRKEARMLLGRFALAVGENGEAVSTVNETVLREITAFVPEKKVVQQPLMTEEQLNQMVQAVVERIYVYGMSRSRQNQLLTELSRFHDHPEEGRLLRGLHQALPPQSQMTDTVRREIARLRWQRAGEAYVEQPEALTASGSTL